MKHHRHGKSLGLASASPLVALLKEEVSRFGIVLIMQHLKSGLQVPEVTQNCTLHPGSNPPVQYVRMTPTSRTWMSTCGDSAAVVERYIATAE